MANCKEKKQDVVLQEEGVVKTTMMNNYYPTLQLTIEKALQKVVSSERKNVLQNLIQYIQHKLDRGEPIRLNFICTHNSRRSQLSQIWAHVAAHFYGIPVNCFSGGVEVTAFNERAVRSIERSGFQVSSSGEENPVYEISFGEGESKIKAFSKLFDDPANHSEAFAAVMTCAHADNNCPFIPGAEARIAVRYDDPKVFDDSPQEAEKYDERSLQIASEMFYVFSKIRS